MNRTLMVGAFLAVMTVLVGGSHYYLWMRLVRDPQLPGPWRHIATTGLIALAVLLPSSLVLGRILRPSVAAPLLWVGFVWMGLVFFLLVTVGSGDLMRVAGIVYYEVIQGSPDPHRRVFFSRLLGGGAAAGASLLGLAALRFATAAPRIKRVRIALHRLPAALDGMALVQLSDLHVGLTIAREVVEDLARRVNEMKPDLVVITGDLVDGSIGAPRCASVRRQR